MRTIDEVAQIIRRSVKAGGREKIDSIVAQPKFPGKSAIGIISITVIPQRASSGSCSAAACQVPSA